MLDKIKHIDNSTLTVKIVVFYLGQSSSAKKISCNVAPLFHHHDLVIQHLVSYTLYQSLLSLISKENVHNVRYNQTY
jgi:L-rhamnose isomerase